MSEEMKGLLALAYLLLIPGVAWFASSRMRRSAVTWVLLSLLVTPVVALVFLLVLGPQASPGDDQAGRDEGNEE